MIYDVVMYESSTCSRSVKLSKTMRMSRTVAGNSWTTLLRETCRHPPHHLLWSKPFSHDAKTKQTRLGHGMSSGECTVKLDDLIPRGGLHVYIML